MGDSSGVRRTYLIIITKIVVVDQNDRGLGIETDLLKFVLNHFPKTC